jgi:alkylhydroperoxidase family enzyme
MTIAVAMRRCYSTKTIEEIEVELERKGPEYWKFLLAKCMQDKSLDVLEHFTMSLLAEGAGEEGISALARRFPYLRASRLNSADWLLSMNARTLVELWRDRDGRPLAEAVVAELEGKKVSPLFNELAFRETGHAR